MNRLFLFAACVALFVAGGCAGKVREQASQPATVGHADSGKSVVSEDVWDEEADVKVSDPFEPMNRAIFSFNHGLYLVVIKPVSKAYDFIFPELLRRGIHNAYNNVRFPVRLVNHSLQGKFDRAAKETGKFLVNTTAGIGGLMTPADKIPALAEVPVSDTGQTFAKWGIPPGPYLVLPLLGPSGVRDGIGAAGDAGLNPVSWVAFIFGGAVWTVAVSAPDSAHRWPLQMDQYDTMTKDSLDHYIAARTAYIQYRQGVEKK